MSSLMWQTCTICGAIFDPAIADHYAWHTANNTGTTPAPEEAPDGD